VGELYFWNYNTIAIVACIVLITKTVSTIGGALCFAPAAKEKVNKIETNMPIASFKKINGRATLYRTDKGKP
jgi:hypothetical protein